MMTCVECDGQMSERASTVKVHDSLCYVKGILKMFACLYGQS